LGAASPSKLDEWENVTPAGGSPSNADFSNDNYGGSQQGRG
jgi:hypothetical protein